MTATAETPQQLNLLFSEDLGGVGNPYTYLYSPDLRLKRIFDQWALYLPSNAEPIMIAMPLPQDVVAEARFYLTGGAAYLQVRRNENNYYKASLNHNGQVELYRGGQQVASAAIAGNGPNQWRILRLSAIGSSIRVSVDGLEILSYTDDNPLPAGLAYMGGDNLDQNGLYIDDVYFWTPIAPESNFQGGLSANDFAALDATPDPPYASLFYNGTGILFNGKMGTLPADVMWVDSQGIHYPTNRTGYLTASDGDRSAVLQKRVFQCTTAINAAYDLCISNIDGSGTVNLTNSPTTAEMEPVFSPLNSDWIAFRYEGDGETPQIHALNILTQQEVLVTTTEELGTAASMRPNIDWGPDNQIYWSTYVGLSGSDRDTRTGIYRKDMSDPLEPGEKEQKTAVASDPLDGNTFPCLGHANPDAVQRQEITNHDFLLTFTGCSPSGTETNNSILIYNLSLQVYQHDDEDTDAFFTAPSVSDMNYAVMSPDARAVAFLTKHPADNFYDLFVLPYDHSVPSDGEGDPVPVELPYQAFASGIVWVPDVLPVGQPPLEATETAEAEMTLTVIAAMTQTRQEELEATQTAQAQTCDLTNDPSQPLGNHFMSAPNTNGQVGVLRHHLTIIPGRSDVAHVFRDHVGKSPTELYGRFVKKPRLRSATTFWDLASANNMIGYTLNFWDIVIKANSSISIQAFAVPLVNFPLGTGGGGVYLYPFDPQDPLTIPFSLPPAYYAGWGSAGWGYKRDLKNPTKPAEVIFPNGVFVLPVCNWQNGGGIKYTIYTAYPEIKK